MAQLDSTCAHCAMDSSVSDEGVGVSVTQAFMDGDLKAGFQVFVDNYKKCVLLLQHHQELPSHASPHAGVHSVFANAACCWR